MPVPAPVMPLDNLLNSQVNREGLSTPCCINLRKISAIDRKQRQTKSRYSVLPMLQRLRLLTTSLGSAMLLLIVLCLGSQNLNDRHSLNLGFTKTAPLPSGFLVGVSVVLGVISGGSTAALLIPTPKS